MATLEEIRKKYPQYDGVDDDTLASAIYQKHYAHADRREFDARIGLKPYQNMAEAALTAVQGIPARAQLAVSGLKQQFAEMGDPKAEETIARMGADFSFSGRMDTGEKNLIQWGKAQLGAGKSPMFTPTQLKQIEELARQPGAAESYKQFLSDPESALVSLSPQKAAEAELAGTLEREAIQKDMPVMDVAEGSAEQIVGGALGSVVEMAPGLGASLVTKSPAPAMAQAQLMAQGQAYGEARAKGLDADTAGQYAILQGAAEGIPELLPLSVLLKEGGGMLARTAKSAAAETVQEGFTELLQAMLDKGYIEPDMTWGEIWPRIKTAALTGAVAGAVTGPIAHGANKLLSGMGTQAEIQGIYDSVLGENVVSLEDAPIEEMKALPAAPELLALPAPKIDKPPLRRNAQQMEMRLGDEEPSEVAFSDHIARVDRAIKKTGQPETAELREIAEQTEEPAGNFVAEEVPEKLFQRTTDWKAERGKPFTDRVTIPDMVRAGATQEQINSLLQTRFPKEDPDILTFKDVETSAEKRNIVSSDNNFKEFMFRAVGSKKSSALTQTQLNVLKIKLDTMPRNERPTTLPVVDPQIFDEGQYNKALDAIRGQGRFTLKAVKDATGLRDSNDAKAIRDLMVERGQLVRKGPTDFRLYDVLGAERQATPGDVPEGDFTEYVVKRAPVSRVKVMKNGKSVGSFNSASAARDAVRAIRKKEETSKAAPARVSIETGEDTAFAVMENRYAADGTLVGQVPVDSSTSREKAAQLADERNNPVNDTRYTVEAVTPSLEPAPTAPLKREPPAALAGRVGEVVEALNKQASQRGLPLINTKVVVQDTVKDETGREVEGSYLPSIINIAAAHLSPDMTTNEVIESLAQVMDHELIHALHNEGILGSDTKGWKTLERYVAKAKRPGAEETYMDWAKRNYIDVPGYDAPGALTEEAIADAFRMWAANKRNVAGQPASVFRQLVEWFKRLFKALPEDVFKTIETGEIVKETLTPEGANMPRSQATETAREASIALAEAQAAQDVPAARTAARTVIRSRAQAREDRYGKAGPKTVVGTTPSKSYDVGAKMDVIGVDAIVENLKDTSGVQVTGLNTYLPEDVAYSKKVADAQQEAAHNPKADKVAKAYRALQTETRTMFNALGEIEISVWEGDGSPYANPEEMLTDIRADRLKMTLSSEMFGGGADNPNHPMYEASGVRTTDGQSLVYNDLLRVVHDVYGKGRGGLGSSPRDAYNAYHAHAQFLSPEARSALATETLAQNSWFNYGKHLRRPDGTVAKPTDVDYLPDNRKEFPEQKAYVLPDELIEADPAWALIEDANQIDKPVETDAPKYSRFDETMPGGRLYGVDDISPGGVISAPTTTPMAFTSDKDGNRHFAGEMAEAQLEMVREGHEGAALLYLSPEEFLSLSNQPVNPDQAAYDGLIADGYKFSKMPSLILKGYAGKIRVTDTDGAEAVRALIGKAEAIPVVLYPDSKENMGLITSLEHGKTKLPFPKEGRQENYLDERSEKPKYSLNAPYGDRVPREPLDTRNVVDQRVEGVVGNMLFKIGRSKKHVPVIGSIFDARIKYQDKMLSVKEMVEDVKAMHGNITDETNTYLVEQLAAGRTVHQVEHREETIYEPLFLALKEATTGQNAVTVREFEDYLYARHAPERNRYLRSKGSKVADPSGMSDAEANALLDKFALDGKLPALERVATFADAISANTTDTRVEAGLIRQEAADKSPYEHYIPLRGRAEEDLDPDDVLAPSRVRSGKGYTIGGREDRHATGRERKAGDLISHLILQNTESVIRAEKNRVAMSFMRLIQDNPDSGFGKMMPKAPTRWVVGPNGMIQETGDPSYRQRPDIFTAKYKGQELIAKVDDPRVARAMKADFADQSNKFVQTLAKINRYLATVNTSFNPEFLISNLARDLQTAGILAAQYDIPGMTKKVVTNAPAAAVGIREVLREGTASTTMARAFEELRATGGTTEFLGIHDLETHIARLRQDAAATGLNTTARQAFNHVRNIGKFIDDYNKVAENAFRLSAYVAAREAGVSVDKSAYLAKNLTVNFNKGGENKAVMNSLYLFYNASISGSFVLFNGLKSKRVQKIVGGIVAAGALQDIMNRMLSGDDDENGVKDYDDIPDYILEHNWVFMIPGTKDYVALPMPYGFNVFHNMGRNFSNAFSGSPVHSPGKSALSTLMTGMSAFNPMGGSESIFNFIAPTIADPFVDLMTNRDFAGNNIVPERPTFGLETPDSQKYWNNIGEIPRQTAEHLNRLTGGSEVRKGAVDVSPEVLQYWFDYATGATGKFVQRTAALGENLATGTFEDIQVGDVPFVRRVYGTVNNRGNTERYFENAQRVSEADAELKLAKERNDGAMARSVLTNYPADVSMIDVYKRGDKTLADIRKQIREVKETSALGEKRKREIVRELRERQDAIMAQLNKLYFERSKATR